MLDMTQKGRNAVKENSSLAVRGERQGHARFSEHDVRNMRSLKEAGSSYSEIAELFDTSVSTVHQIVSRKSWAHVL